MISKALWCKFNQISFVMKCMTNNAYPSFKYTLNFLQLLFSECFQNTFEKRMFIVRCIIAHHWKCCIISQILGYFRFEKCLGKEHTRTHVNKATRQLEIKSCRYNKNLSPYISNLLVIGFTVGNSVLTMNSRYRNRLFRTKYSPALSNMCFCIAVHHPVYFLYSINVRI